MEVRTILGKFWGGQVQSRQICGATVRTKVAFSGSGLPGPRKIGEEDRSESGQVLENFGLHLGPIRTGFAKFFKTVSAGVRTGFWNLGQVRCLSGQKKMMEIFFYTYTKPDSFVFNIQSQITYHNIFL